MSLKYEPASLPQVIQEHTVVCIRNLSMALDNVVTIMENDALP